MDNKLSTRILQNSFVSSLMEHQLDKAAFADLCCALQDLAKAWNGKTHVEKALALELYVTAAVMRNEILYLREIGHKTQADELADMFIEVDRLISEECLI